eukprot:30173-Chlamydomonas_euryale.AAC.4
MGERSDTSWRRRFLRHILFELTPSSACPCVQDTPGYGDTLDLSRAIGVVTSHIEQQNEKWLQLEQSRERKEDLADVEDPRIDLCLFCVGPHRWEAHHTAMHPQTLPPLCHLPMSLYAASAPPAAQAPIPCCQCQRNCYV